MKCGHLNVLISGGGSIQIQVLTLLSAQLWVYLLIALFPSLSCFEIELSFLLMAKCNGQREDRIGKCIVDFCFCFGFICLYL